METVKVIGIKKLPSSKDSKRIGTTIYFTQPFDNYSVENAIDLTGFMCGEEFTYSEVNCKVGDEVELVYRKGFQNMAVLSEIKVVKSATVKQVPTGNG